MKTPVRELCGLEDLAARMERARIPIDANTMFTCFINGLPKSEFEQEIRDIGLMETYNRKEIVRLVRNRFETLKKRQDQNGPSNALIAHVRGNGRRGGRGGRGGGRGSGNSWKGKSDDGNDAAEEKASDKGPMCYNCRCRGHFARECTTKLCKRCNGRGHDEDRRPSSADVQVNMAVELVDSEDSDESVSESILAAAF